MFENLKIFKFRYIHWKVSFPGFKSNQMTFFVSKVPSRNRWRSADKFRYPQHPHQTHRSFKNTILKKKWKSSLCRTFNTVVCQIDLFFVPKNWFFLNIFWNTCRMTLIFLRPRRAMLGGPFTYLQHFDMLHKNFIGRLKVNFHGENQHFWEVWVEYSNASIPRKIHFFNF